ncbi:hypothetical protein [Chryseobacterium sp. ZHDP1]|uniref:hypothetical protein n=1 Tax=Chryseobacterium sp. ZHDP1 TaxID=2838877 RepID=UPI001BE025FE|nr:hypothetical protein [Chryseobacterium sp. ZHDP1]QWA38874.1 hypothetical protein KKI44_01280 [Chryseobacterium sp. ZHDP1]
MDIVKYTKDNTFQRIKAWYIDETSVQLTPAEEKKKDRLKHIWALRCNNRYSPKDTVKIIERDYKVSQATAYRDYNLSMELFGNMDQVNIAAEKMIIAEGYWDLYLSAKKKGKEEVALRALEKYESLYNFEDTTQKVDPKKLEASVYNLKIPRGVEKMLKGMFDGGVVNFNNIGAEDVDWKEITEDEDEQNEEEYE